MDTTMAVILFPLYVVQSWWKLRSGNTSVTLLFHKEIVCVDARALSSTFKIHYLGPCMLLLSTFRSRNMSNWYVNFIIHDLFSNCIPKSDFCDERQSPNSLPAMQIHDSKLYDKGLQKVCASEDVLLHKSLFSQQRAEPDTIHNHCVMQLVLHGGACSVCWWH